jgi:hypothetical protein
MFQIRAAYLNGIHILSDISIYFRIMSRFDKVNTILYRVYVNSGHIGDMKSK